MIQGTVYVGRDPTLGAHEQFLFLYLEHDACGGVFAYAADYEPQLPEETIPGHAGGASGGRVGWHLVGWRCEFEFGVMGIVDVVESIQKNVLFQDWKMLLRSTTVAEKLYVDHATVASNCQKGSSFLH